MTCTADSNLPTDIPEFQVLEETTPQMTGQLTDETGADVALADLDEITLTLFIPESGTIVNTRNKQDVKNNNNVIISASGLITWDVQQEDLEVIDTVDDENTREIHRALFEFEFDSNARHGKKQIDLVIHNLQKVP